MEQTESTDSSGQEASDVLNFCHGSFLVHNSQEKHVDHQRRSEKEEKKTTSQPQEIREICPTNCTNGANEAL